MNMSASDRVDLGLVSYPEPTREIAVLPWRSEEMVLAAAPTHPLASRECIYPQDLNGVDFVTFDDDLPISREISRYLNVHGVEVNTTMRFDNIQTIKEAVILGSGVSIFPARILQAELAEGGKPCHCRSRDSRDRSESYTGKRSVFIAPLRRSSTCYRKRPQAKSSASTRAASILSQKSEHLLAGSRPVSVSKILVEFGKFFHQSRRLRCG